jgi:hypothetical protein
MEGNRIFAIAVQAVHQYGTQAADISRKFLSFTEMLKMIDW